MKQLGYAALFLIFVIIIIPLTLVKGCEQKDKPLVEKKAAEELGTINVYIVAEDKVIDMNFNEYLKGVVAAEMPASFHIEALKAQAVAARTYALHRLLNQKKNDSTVPEHKGADVCTDSTHCKAWISMEDAIEKWGTWSGRKYWRQISKSVEDTSSIIITYNGEPIDAVFHSTSSGKTENSEDVWTNAIPYLRSIKSEGEEFSPKYTSKVEVSIQEFMSRINNVNSQVIWNSSIEASIGKADRTEGGSIKTIVIGNQPFKGTEIRKIFQLNSANFTIDVKGNMVVFNVLGNGHGVGMSQYGANYLASQGKTFEEILSHYYQNIDIVLMVGDKGQNMNAAAEGMDIIESN